LTAGLCLDVLGKLNLTVLRKLPSWIKRRNSEEIGGNRREREREGKRKRKGKAGGRTNKPSQKYCTRGGQKVLSLTHLNER